MDAKGTVGDQEKGQKESDRRNIIEEYYELE
jgi:hypothetical protein